MHPVGIIFAVCGLVQAIGAISRSRLFQALPHFRRTERLFGTKAAVVLHAIFGVVVALVGAMILAGLIPLD